MIEIAPTKYRKSLITYDEAQFYCFTLNINNKIGWRLPSLAEYHNNDEITGWWQGREISVAGQQYLNTCVPVRDI